MKWVILFQHIPRFVPSHRVSPASLSSNAGSKSTACEHGRQKLLGATGGTLGAQKVIRFLVNHIETLKF